VPLKTCLAEKVRCSDKHGKPNRAMKRNEIEDKLGIKIGAALCCGLHAGFPLPFARSRQGRAAADRKLNPYLLDEATGARLSVPTAPKSASCAQPHATRLSPGHYYICLPIRALLKIGNKVTLVAGDALINHLTIE
jgi:hypothetical protein